MIRDSRHGAEEKEMAMLTRLGLLRQVRQRPIRRRARSAETQELGWKLVSLLTARLSFDSNLP